MKQPCLLLSLSVCLSLTLSMSLALSLSRFNEELGVVYMAARLAGGYTAVRRALNEVTRIISDQ